ncbi:hypothetical protein KAI56_04120 [Candidatus Parcubacteria bacterium]|nr:hypothetical protein [Candidatus Parcubacteria bacterium]
MRQFKINKNILSVSLSLIIFFLLIISYYYFSQNIKLTKIISSLNNQIRILTQTNVDIKSNSLSGQDETKEEIKKNEYRFNFNNIYLSPKHNITLRYNKDVPHNELESILFENENVIRILIPAKPKNQDIVDCSDDYYYNKKICYKFYDIKYFENTNKLTIYENNFNDIKQAISDLIEKEGGDMKNCDLQIENYKDNKKIILKLSDNLTPTEEEVEKWVEINGDKSGAYLNKQFVQAEKSEKLCSKFAQSDMPYVNFFIFNENRKDIFVYFEFNFASEHTYIDPWSIRFLN